jgi:hypothetical protein
MGDEVWTPEALMDLIAEALKRRDMDTVAIALQVLAVKSPQDAQTILDALDLAAVLP